MTRFRSDGRCVAELYHAMSAGTGVKAVSASTVLVAALLSCAAQAAPVGERVALTACPHAGITAPCLTVNGADGTLYNITAATQRPPLNGRMIRLRATVTDKLSTCLQGTMLDRIRWTPVRQKCTN
jgi:hypothetical protein